MTIQEAIQILEVVKCDRLGHCRDLSVNPTSGQIGQAIDTLLQFVTQVIYRGGGMQDGR